MTDPPAASSPAGGPSVDLHMHSTRSDGTVPPREVVRAAAEAGLAGMALTDHDTTEGVDEAAAAAREYGLRFLPGAEVSANEPGRSVHLLAYGFDLRHAGLQAFLRTIRADRERRARATVGKLNRAGVPLAYEAVLRQSRDAAPTRAHIGRALLAEGHVPTLQAAFDRYIANGGPCHVPKQPIPPRVVFETVRAAGGVVLLAHPGRKLGADDVRRWVDEGLDGVEVVHPANAPEVRSRMRALADELGLLQSGGSDWHGPNDGRRGQPGWAHVPLRWMERIAAAATARRA